jgi:hypothetical protein
VRCHRGAPPVEVHAEQHSAYQLSHRTRPVVRKRRRPSSARIRQQHEEASFNAAELSFEFGGISAAREVLADLGHLAPEAQSSCWIGCGARTVRVLLALDALAVETSTCVCTPQTQGALERFSPGAS